MLNYQFKILANYQVTETWNGMYVSPWMRSFCSRKLMTLPKLSTIIRNELSDVKYGNLRSSGYLITAFSSSSYVPPCPQSS